MRTRRRKPRQDERYVTARAVFEEEYRTTFGCDWDLTPWGERWPAVFARALEADRRYNTAEGLLADLARAFNDAVSYLQRRGLDPFASSAPLEGSDFAGHTLPEVALLLAICDEGRAFLAARWLVQALAEERAQRLVGGMEATARTAAGDLPLFEGFVDGHDGIGTDRTLRIAQFQMPRAAERVRRLVPALLGSPPRSLVAEAEWRRTYLADVFAVVKRILDANAELAFTDRDVAIVSLLAGGIDGYTAPELANPSAVANAERKAIALARRRRAVSEKVRREAERANQLKQRPAPPARKPAVVTPAAPPRITTSPAYRNARTALEREYRNVFGEPWDVPPWGRSRWSEILPRALELDRTYLECIGVIEEVVVAIDRAHEFLLQRGIEITQAGDEQLELSQGVGLTLPEYELRRACTQENRAMSRARDQLRELLETVQTKWNTGIADRGPLQPQADKFVEVVNSVVPSRGLQRFQIVRPDGLIVWSGWAPGIYAPPPGSLRTDVHEWRRWFVATLLQSYENGRRRSSPVGDPETIVELDVDSTPYVKDRVVAVVSLLAGGLELYSVAAMRDLPKLIDSERRAVALARKRARRALAVHWKQRTESAPSANERLPEC